MRDPYADPPTYVSSNPCEKKSYMHPQPIRASGVYSYPIYPPGIVVITAEAVKAFHYVKDIFDRSSACWGPISTAPQPISFITTLKDHLVTTESQRKQLKVDNTRFHTKQDLYREKLISAEDTSKRQVLENREAMEFFRRDLREAERTSGMYRRITETSDLEVETFKAKLRSQREADEVYSHVPLHSA